jgi:hypothetical protein
MTPPGRNDEKDRQRKEKDCGALQVLGSDHGRRLKGEVASRASFERLPDTESADAGMTPDAIVSVMLPPDVGRFLHTLGARPPVHGSLRVIGRMVAARVSRKPPRKWRRWSTR